MREMHLSIILCNIWCAAFAVAKNDTFVIAIMVLLTCIY